MKLNAENIKQYAHEVMDRRQVADYNEFAGTKYTSSDTLLDTESASAILEFYAPAQSVAVVQPEVREMEE